MEAADGALSETLAAGDAALSQENGGLPTESERAGETVTPSSLAAAA